VWVVLGLSDDMNLVVRAIIFYQGTISLLIVSVDNLFHLLVNMSMDL